MRKLVPLCLVTLAMTVSACGDDEGAIVPNDTPDGSAESTTKADSGAGEATSETTADEPTSVAPATDAGGELTIVVVDAGNDSGTEPVTDVDAGDSGVTSEPTIDGGPVGDVDGGDGGVVVSEACASACAAAGAACADTSTCAADICGGIYQTAPNCIEEADAYLACMGTAPAEDFECGGDNKPSYVSTGCDDPTFNAWLACAFPQ